jgi:hypothetical protein
MAEPKAKLFYLRSKGSGPAETDNWFSYMVGSNGAYVLHEWSIPKAGGGFEDGSRTYSVKEFLRNDDFNGRPKIKLGELLRTQ